MRKLLITICIFITLLSLTGCNDYDLKKPLAKIENRVITIGDFVEYYMRATKNGRPVSIPEMNTKNDVKEFLHTLLIKDALVIEAENRGLYEREDFIRKLNRKQSNIAIEDLEKTITAGIEVTDEECMDFYRHISKELVVNAISFNTKKVAQEALERIRNGEEFDKIAREYDPYWSETGKAKEGVLTYSFHEGIAETMELKEGQVSEIIKVPTEPGYVIFKVIEVKPREVEPYEETKKGIKRYIEGYKKRKVIEEYQNRLLEEYDFEIYEDNVRIAIDGTDEDIRKATEEKVILAKIDDEYLTFDMLFPTGEPSELFNKVKEESKEEAFESLLEIIRKGAKNKLFKKRALELKGYEKPEYQKELKDLKEEWAIDTLYEEDFRPTIEEPTDEEIREYYYKNKEWYDDPAEVTTYIIKVENEDIANEVYEKAVGGEDFNELVKKYSIDEPSKKHNGLMILLEDDEDYPEIFKSAFESEIGDITPPVEASDSSGYYIIKLVNKKPRKEHSIEEDNIYRKVKRDLIHEIETSEDVDAKCREWMESILNKYEYEIYKENFDETLRAVRDKIKERGPVPVIEPTKKKKRKILY
ncbi:MAG TPA: hypothetical protein ENI43_05460 [Firmicutes bacterium]|nr:hypothetical protein [Bacillota bacterium]